MDWQFTPIIFTVVFAAFTSAGLAVFGWQRRESAWAYVFTVLMLSIAVWTFGYALELASVSLSSKIFWAKIQYIGIVATPLAWFLFAMQYSGRESWLARRVVVSLSVIPIITLLFVITNESHGLIWAATAVDNSGSLSVLDVSYGGWFWIHSAYSYVLILVGTGFLFQAFSRFPTTYRWQLALLATAPLVPMLGNGLYLSGYSPLGQLDLTPLAFALSGLIFTWGIFRLQLFQIVPVARRIAVDNMREGMLVLDRENRIVDINPAAIAILNAEGQKIIGEPLGPMFANRPDLIDRFGLATHANEEIFLNHSGLERWYDLQISPLYDSHNLLRGRLIILHDITQRKRAEKELESRNVTLEMLNKLAQEIATTLEIQQVLNTAVASITQILDVTSAYISAWDIENGTATVVAEYFAPSACALERVSDLGIPYDLEQDFGTTTDWLFDPEDDYVVQVDDPHLPLQEKLHLMEYGGKSVLEVPILANNRPLGSLELWESRHKREFERWEIDLVISVAKQVALAMDNANLYQKALELSQQKTTLLARVSQELRTPLSIILLYADIMDHGRYGPLTEKQKEAVSKIISNSNNLTNLVKSLLDQAALDAGELEIVLGPVDLREIADDVEAQYRETAANKHLSLKFDVASNVLETFIGDATRIRQILDNLVSNAIKFTPHGVVKVRIFQPDEHHFTMRVSDTGIGIASESQSTIFEPFQQAVDLEKSEFAGAGLGLSIVKHLVSLFDASLT